MSKSAASPNAAPTAASSPLPWVLLALWILWMIVLAWMARGEFTKERPRHERERSSARESGAVR